MNNLELLVNEAIYELRAYMLQVYTYTHIPISLLKTEELLLDIKDSVEKAKLPLLVIKDSEPNIGSFVKEAINNITMVSTYGK